MRQNAKKGTSNPIPYRTLYIVDGEVNSDGDIDNLQSFELLLSVDGDTNGELLGNCGSWGQPNSVGKWRIASHPFSSNVSTDSLTHMCVEENEAYVPQETWTTSEGIQRICTNEYAISDAL